MSKQTLSSDARMLKQSLDLLISVLHAMSAQSSCSLAASLLITYLCFGNSDLCGPDPDALAPGSVHWGIAVGPYK